MQREQGQTQQGERVGWELPEIIPREALYGNPEKTSPRLSPDGSKLAYLAPENGVLNVWVRTLGQEDDRVVTSDKKRGVRIFVWQGDSAHLLYMQDQDGDENWHVYQTNLATRNTRDLTPFQDVAAQLEDVDPRFPDQMLVALNLRDRRFHDVYRVNLKNGAVELEAENPGDVGGWVADNAMQVRAAQAMTPDGGTEIRFRDGAQGEWKTRVTMGPDETFGGVVGFSPDNAKAWLLSSLDANASRLVEMDLASGAVKVLAEDPQYDAGGILAHPTKRTLEAVNFTRARSEWQALDPAIQPDFDALRQVRDGDFSVVSRDLADTKWIVAYDLDDGPVTYYLYDRASRKAEFLFTNRPVLEKYRLAKMQPVSYPARDGMTVHAYLTLPVGVEPKNLPTILLVHGGPWGRDTWGFDSLAQHLSNRGYAVLQINFRGSTGYGKAFLNAGDKQWARAMHTDLLDGKQWAIAQGVADPQRVAIMGGSYGGYATLVGMAFTPEEFACGVDIVGPSNLLTLLNTIPPYWTALKSLFIKRLGDPETEAEMLQERSPLHKADQITKPLLIAQGANDPRVKQAESDQIVEAMRKNGQEVEYLLFPDEGHGFARPENNLKFFAAAEAFLAKHLGGRAEPPSDKESAEGLRK